MSEIKPKCPECGVSGKEHIDHTESELTSRGGDPWFDIVFCNKCGHVYGVFNKIGHGATTRMPPIQNPFS